MWTSQSLLVLAASCASAVAQTSYRAIPTLSASINAAPSLVPNILDPTAPNAQDVCPGYRASNIVETSHGLTADLNLAGAACNVYGNDIAALSLSVEYQSRSRLNVRIVPRYIAPSNQSQYILSPYLTGLPAVEGNQTLSNNELNFTYTNQPSFQFEVARAGSGDVIFSTFGKVIVFEDQFLELATSMPANYNVYGLAENIHQFRLGNNYTQTFFNADSGNPIDGNLYGTHPMYLETRYHNGSASTSHGVYARNAHGQEWLLRATNITYRTLGGSFDFYFLSGPTPKDVIAQYQGGIVGYPAMQMYWTFGFHQCRWGYENWTVMQEIVDGYADAGIQLETIWNDIDYMDQYRDFTNGQMNYPVPEGQAFLARLHAAGQHYVPIVDANIYAPNPTNGSDRYSVFERGAELNAFIRNGADSFYYGDNWPGFSVWADMLVPQGQQLWTESLTTWYRDIQYDGIWIDLNEASSFCVGSCGQFRLTENPVHPPFKLPGEAGNIDYRYPEGFNVTNATEAASATSASMAQSSANAASATSSSAVATSTSAFVRTQPTPGVRNLNFPPYVINNVFEGHALVKTTISPNATHNDPYNTTEYENHNLFGHELINATYNALLQVFPGRRPFIIGRSTFSGSGKVAGHWGGDNTSMWGSMYFAIAQALQFAIAGIPMFGADACGFAGNTDMELCNRWMQLSAFFPFYRNHNVFASIPQEAFRWASVAEATRTVMNIRFLLLPYMYTLFEQAHTSGQTVLRALQWEFPNDAQLAGIDNQFMLGPSLLITPVLQPLVDYVQGVFPGVAEGTIWYDWYTLQPVDVQPGENKTLPAPLGHINLHIRGGSILPLQQPGNNTATSRRNPWSILVALDKNGQAEGSLYLDDGESLVQNATKSVQLSFSGTTLRTKVTGSFSQNNPLANITIAGVAQPPTGISLNIAGNRCSTGAIALVYSDGVLQVTGLESITSGGVWEEDLVIEFPTRNGVNLGQSSRAQSSQTQSTQASATRGQSSQAQATQAQSSQASATLAQSSQSQASQAQSAQGQSSQASQAQSSRAQSTQASAGSGQSSQAQASPAQSTQAQSSQATQAQSSRAQSTQASAASGQSSQAQASQAQSTQAQSSQAQGSQAQATQAQSSQAQSTQAQSSQAQGSQAQATQAQSSQAQAIQAQSSQAQGSQAQNSQAQGSQAQATQAQSSQAQATQAQNPQGQATQAPNYQAHTWAEGYYGQQYHDEGHNANNHQATNRPY